MAGPSITEPPEGAPAEPQLTIDLWRIVQVLVAVAVLLTSMLAFTPAFGLMEHLRIPLAVAALVALTAAARPRNGLAAKFAIIAFLLNALVVIPHLPWNGQTQASYANAVVLHANVHGPRADPDSFLSLVRETGPDVLVLLEVSHPEWEPLQALAGDYPHRLDCGRPYCRIVVLSRWPLRSLERTVLVDDGRGGRPAVVIARVDRPQGPFTLVGTHLTRPFHPEIQGREAAWLSQTVRSLPAPLVLTGDFNAAPWSRLFEALEGDSGTGRLDKTGATWPVWLGPFGIPIDHILASGDVRGAVRASGGFGSDHRALIAEIILPE